MDSNEPFTRAFPESLNGHSLAALAEAADFRVLTAVEEDALGHGEDYIEWIGRYPTALRPESVAAGRAMAPSALHAAFVAMFHRAVERVAQEVTERGRHPPQYTRADWIKREQEFFLGLASP
jgi:hypothetical protein